jgi:hypothetical protein
MSIPDHGGAQAVTGRALGLAGNPNLRDIGGYQTADGRWVRAAAPPAHWRMTRRVTAPTMAG